MSLAGGGRTSDQPIENPTATNNTASQTITVAVGEKTRICHFDTSGASKVIIVGNRALPDHFGHGDCLSILPKGTVGCTCAPPPSIDSLTATPGTIDKAAGESSTLAWTTTNANNCSIDNGVGSVACDGNTSVSPTATTVYTLSATGPGGGPVSAQATVTVEYCHSINTTNDGLCPSGATEFCEAVPIDATSSSHAQDACNACLDSGVCTAGVTQNGGSSWQGVFDLGHFQYTNDGVGGCATPNTAGTISNGCNPHGRWAP